MTSSIPLVVALVRIWQGYAKFDIWKWCKKRKVAYARDSLMSEGGLGASLTRPDEFEWLEKKILENVSRV